MEKIPQEVHRILKQVADQLEELKRDTANVTVLHDHIKLLDCIDGFRKTLTVLDANYEDCYSVLVGYLRYQTEAKMKNIKQTDSEPANDKQPNG